MFRRFTQTVATALAFLCVTSTLALAQVRDDGARMTSNITTRSTTVRMSDREAIPWPDTWYRVGSGGSNYSQSPGVLNNERELRDRTGTNSVGADAGSWYR